MPEKKMEELNIFQMTHDFHVNACATPLFAKHLLPFFKNEFPAVFAALSARVGSIGDNKSGGWYSYRASKTALNMYIKNISIEYGRKKTSTHVVAIHPGTVDTPMTKPFASRNKYQLHQPLECYRNLIKSINSSKEFGSGCFVDWKGDQVDW